MKFFNQMNQFVFVYLFVCFLLVCSFVRLFVTKYYCLTRVSGRSIRDLKKVKPGYEEVI